MLPSQDVQDASWNTIKMCFNKVLGYCGLLFIIVLYYLLKFLAGFHFIFVLHFHIKGGKKIWHDLTFMIYEY